jgi:hypothetical protein
MIKIYIQEDKTGFSLINEKKGNLTKAFSLFNEDETANSNIATEVDNWVEQEGFYNDNIKPKLEVDNNEIIEEDE